MIDASTCWFPNETWFIKNMQHVGFNDTQNQCDLYTWLMTTQKQVTVQSNPDFPQFLLYNTETNVLSPLSLLRGDVNFDGIVNLVDARMVLRHVRTVSTLSALAKEAADMDGNAHLTHTDVQMIMDTHAGLSTASGNKTFSAAGIRMANGRSPDSGSALDGLKDTLGGALDSIKGMFGEQNVPQDTLSSLRDMLPESTYPDTSEENEANEAELQTEIESVAAEA